MPPRLLSPAELPLEREAVAVYRLARPQGSLAAAGPIDWARLLGWAQGMGGVAALQRAIMASPAVDVPPEVSSALRRMGMTSSFALLYLRERLQESIAALERVGVPCMPLKGAAFLLADPAAAMVRPMGDIDLLVRPEHAMAARTALLAAGWKTSVFEVREEFYAEHHHLPPFDDVRRTGLSLEVHTEPLPPWHPFGLRAADLWATAKPLPGQPSVVMPSAPAMLLHACLHFVWAHMGQLGAWRLVRDVDALVAAGSIDWPAFVRTATAAKAATSCYWALRLSRELGEVPVPDAVLDALAPRLPEALRRRLARHLILRTVAPPGLPCPSVRLERLLWEMMVKPGASGHGRVRPWAREAPRFTRRAASMETPPTPMQVPRRGVQRMLGVLAHLWRSFGSQASTA